METLYTAPDSPLMRTLLGRRQLPARCNVKTTFTKWPGGGGTTLASIVDDSGALIAAGLARCSLKDDFDPVRGGQIALGRALQQLDKSRA